MEFLPFFILIVAAVIFSAIFNKFHLPWVLALIVSGMVIGPYGLEWFEVNPTISFMSQIGLVLLMFMAGLEVKLSAFKEFRTGVIHFTLLNGLLPATVGFGLGWLLGFTPIAAVLLGIIFMASSIAVIIPTLEAGGQMNLKLGKTIVASTIIVDVASLLALSFVLQVVQPTSPLPLPSFFFLLGLILIGFRYALPKIRSLFPVQRDAKDLFESEVRIVIAMLLGTVITFAALGLHPIIAGFFTGLILSDSINSEILINKLRTIGYGVFIPIFFVVVGAQTNVGVFVENTSAIIFTIILIVASIGSKFGSGFLAARWDGFSYREAVIAGIATTPQLSTTLAVVITAVQLELMPVSLINAIVMLSLVTTLAAPLLLKYLFAHPSALTKPSA
jgi:Kef-type K+ transport system membrane component KefB